MNVKTVCTALVALGSIGVAVAPARWSEAQVVPRTIDIAKVTCAELLALSGDQQDRALIYFDGYVNGMRRTTTWDERVEGARIDRVVADCKANSGGLLLNAFTRAWGP